MNWHKQGGAAFPIPRSNEPGAPECEWGMSLRDWFAGQALASWPHAGREDLPSIGIARQCYRIADAMIVARSATNE